jgi:hypothetical protein
MTPRNKMNKFRKNRKSLKKSRNRSQAMRVRKWMRVKRRVNWRMKNRERNLRNRFQKNPNQRAKVKWTRRKLKF